MLIGGESANNAFSSQTYFYDWQDRKDRYVRPDNFATVI